MSDIYKLLQNIHVIGSHQEYTHIHSLKKATHITSLNPEIIVEASHNDRFYQVLQQVDFCCIDGVGLQYGCHLLFGVWHKKYSGVDYMQDIITKPQNISSVMLIGGSQVARVSIQEKYQINMLTIHEIEGTGDIKHIQSKEKEIILKAIHEKKPDVIFFSFGSPYQEILISELLPSIQYPCICSGVGGAFNFIAGIVPRAPKMMRSMGLEWLYRLVIEPWRFKRQLRLINFVFLMLFIKISYLWKVKQIKS
jgi:N-acetylglucosaminyldiphosphoundecaprenol N-acetyl-beta-D-mannosaminyltransferase